MILNGKILPRWCVPAVASILTVCVATAYWFWPSQIVVAVDPGASSTQRALIEEWARILPLTQDLRRTEVVWVDAAKGDACDLTVTTRAPMPAESQTWAGVEQSERPPYLKGPGKWRNEFTHPSNALFAVAEAAWVYRVSSAAKKQTEAQVQGRPDFRLVRPIPQTVAEIEALAQKGFVVERLPWPQVKELRGTDGIFLPTDRRTMQRLWVLPCALKSGELLTLRGARLRVAQWFYRVNAQNAVIGAGYYSPWDKMVNPERARPFVELELVPEYSPQI